MVPTWGNRPVLNEEILQILSKVYPKYIQLISEFFSAETVRKHLGNRKTSVTSFSMFYDLEAPTQFVQEVADVLDEE